MTECKTKCSTIELKGGHLMCAACGQHEMFVEIDAAGLAGLLEWLKGVHETLVKQGFTDSASALSERVGTLLFNKRFTFELPKVEP